MTRLAEPSISLLIEWAPVGPDSWEGYYGDTLIRVEFDKITDRWRWTVHGHSDTTAYGFRGDRTAAMMTALAFAGCQTARIAEGVV